MYHKKVKKKVALREFDAILIAIVKIDNMSIQNNCFKYISVNANLISVRLKSKRQRINTITFYLRDISTPLAGVVLKQLLKMFENDTD